MQRQLIVAAAFGLTLVGVAAVRSGSTAVGALRPHTLVSVSSRIAAFAQDGDRIAWLAAEAPDCESPPWNAKPLRVRNLATGVQTALPSTQPACQRLTGPLYPSTLALGSTRALWAIVHASRQETAGWFVTAAVNDPQEREACEFDLLGGTEDNYAPTLTSAGDGHTLAFTMNGQAIGGSSSLTCFGLWLVDQQGHAKHVFTSAAQPTLLAVGGTRIALAQTTDSSVELRSARSGRLLATAAADGSVSAVALSQSTLALLVEGSFGRRIELLDAMSTASRGAVDVPASTVPELSAAGADVVFRDRDTIYLLDGNRRTKRILAVATSTPIGLSIEGRRVAWAENDRDRSRIRAIILPSR